MVRSRSTLTVLIATLVIFAGLAIPPAGRAWEPPPQAPAKVSWLPHGYGGKMWVDATICHWQKGLQGFRKAPSHIGCWSHPLWGWDVNGYYHGPNVPCPDPVMCQLPIGLIYPVNSPPAPPRPQRRAQK
jgi:hypothetical protein